MSMSKHSRQPSYWRTDVRDLKDFSFDPCFVYRQSAQHYTWCPILL